jgi:hypothetical protein
MNPVDPHVSEDSLLDTCPDGLGRKFLLQCVFEQPTNVFGQASVVIGLASFQLISSLFSHFSEKLLFSLLGFDLKL